MKKKNKAKVNETYPVKPAEPLVLNDALTLAYTAMPESMVRTQVYLTRPEHEFLQIEAKQRGQPMSAFLRDLIDNRMTLPEDAWSNNPMLEATPEVAGWEGREDGALNHDHYVYGGAKKYEKVGGKWVLLPPLSE
jgi:hypothetical protein